MRRDPENCLHRKALVDDIQYTKYKPRLKAEVGSLDWRCHGWDDDVPYAPREFTAFAVQEAAGKWADYEDPNDDRNRWKQLGLDLQHDASGFPLNPAGRTGLRGRGSHAHWGPNSSIDPVITRRRRGKGDEEIYEMLAERRPNFQCAIPGSVLSLADELAFSLRDVGRAVSITGNTVEVHTGKEEATADGDTLDAPEADGSLRERECEHAAVRQVKWSMEAPPTDLHGTIIDVSGCKVTIQPFDGALPPVTLTVPYFYPMPNKRLGWKLQALIRHYELEQTEVYKDDAPPALQLGGSVGGGGAGTGGGGDAGHDSCTKLKTMLSSEEFGYYQRLWDQMVEDAVVVYSGPVDDVRDTDNAWSNTTVLHFEISEDR